MPTAASAARRAVIHDALTANAALTSLLGGPKVYDEPLHADFLFRGSTMAASSYGDCLARLLAHEGGYTNNRHDPGGQTNFGITILDYRKYVKPGGPPPTSRPCRSRRPDRIHRAKYWDAERCDELPAGVDDCVFDYGVNSGIGRSKNVLQPGVGVNADGVIGRETMTAIGQRAPDDIVNAICDERLRFSNRCAPSRCSARFGAGASMKCARSRCSSSAAPAARFRADAAATPSGARNRQGRHGASPGR